VSRTPRYEIFQKLPLQQPTWVETARGLKEAKDRTKQLKQMFPAEYFIVDHRNSILIVPFESLEPATARRSLKPELNRVRS
jgi:hypothetical protein